MPIEIKSQGGGNPLNPERIRYLQARQKAVEFIGVSLKSTGRVRDKLLEKDFPADVADQVIRDLTALGYLDDYKLALAHIRRRRGRKSEGKALLRARLLSLGIAAGAVERALEEETPPAEEAAYDYLSCRFSSFWEREKAELGENYYPDSSYFYRPEIIKILQNAGRKGFSPALSRRAIERIWMGEETK